MHKDREAVQKDIAARYDYIVTKTNEDEALKQELIRCEVDIVCGRYGYYDMGNSFRMIRKKKSYAIAEYNDFLDYAKKAHGLEKSSVYRLINIADLYDRLVPIVGENNMPHTAYALGAMIGLKPEQEEGVYKLALEKANGKMVAAIHINEARGELGLIKTKSKPESKGEEPDDTPEIDNAEANAVKVDVKGNAVSKQITAKDGSTSHRHKPGVRTDKSLIGVRCSGNSESTGGISKEESAEKIAIELKERLQKFGEEEDITLELIKQLLAGLNSPIKAYLNSTRTSKYRKTIQRLQSDIRDICGKNG